MPRVIQNKEIRTPLEDGVNIALLTEFNHLPMLYYTYNELSRANNYQAKNIKHNIKLFMIFTFQGRPFLLTSWPTIPGLTQTHTNAHKRTRCLVLWDDG